MTIISLYMKSLNTPITRSLHNSNFRGAITRLTLFREHDRRFGFQAVSSAFSQYPTLTNKKTTLLSKLNPSIDDRQWLEALHVEICHPSVDSINYGPLENVTARISPIQSIDHKPERRNLYLPFRNMSPLTEFFDFATWSFSVFNITSLNILRTCVRKDLDSCGSRS